MAKSQRKLSTVRIPVVSVIVTTKNEEEVIVRLLDSINNQTYENIEILVVDNYSTDNTLALAKQKADKIYFKGPERSAQRNYGANKAKGDYLLLLDADMELTKGVIADCVEYMRVHTHVGAISIKEKSVAISFWEKVKAYERSFYNLEGDKTTDAARFFKREVFDKIGGYDESITGPEDWDITDRVRASGYKVGWVPAVIKHHERVPNPIKLARKKYYYGIKSHVYLAKHNIPVLSPKTIYFLRPVFYKNFGRLLAHPILSIALFAMLTCETLGGAFGYMVGRIKAQ